MNPTADGLCPGTWYTYAYFAGDEPFTARSRIAKVRTAIAADSLEPLVVAASACNGSSFNWPQRGVQRRLRARACTRPGTTTRSPTTPTSTARPPIRSSSRSGGCMITFDPALDSVNVRFINPDGSDDYNEDLTQARA